MSEDRRVWPVLALAAVSGAVALVYEVVFFRSLALVFGVTVHAVAAVVASFLFGLGVGALGGGRLPAPRPLVLYAALEVLVGLFGYLSPWLFRGLGNAALGGAFGGGAGGGFPATELGLSFLLLLWPTFLMGATFPVLGRAVAALRAGPIARPIGWLYGWNTVGAVAGALLAAYLLLPNLGLLGTFHLAAGGNIVLALTAIWLHTRTQPRPASPPAATATTPSGAPPSGIPPAGAGGVAPAKAGGVAPAKAGGVALAGASGVPTELWVAVGLVGLVSIGLQVLGNRLLITLLGGSVYAFAVVLATFLLGIGIGGFTGGALVTKSRRPVSLLAVLAIGIGGSVGLGVLLLRLLLGFDEDPLLGAANLRFEGEFGRVKHLGMSFGLAAVTFLPATLLSGAFLPAIVRWLDRGGLARGLGALYFVNTVGAIVGSLAAGFWLLPRFGLRASLTVMAVVALLTGALLVWRAARDGERGILLRVAVLVPLSGLLLFLGLRPGAPPGAADDVVIKFYRESAAASVKVEEFEDASEPEPIRGLAVNGKPVATSMFLDRRLQLLLGFIPTLIHEEPNRILSIALGTGMSSGALALSGAESVEIVELSQGVIDACPLFDRWTGAVLDRENVTIHRDDGRRFLARSEDRYDLISADPIHPWVAGSAFLYTEEYYRLARAHLTERGMMAQWIPLYQLSTEDIAGIVATFLAVFPQASAWLTGYDMVLLGSVKPLVIDAELVANRMFDESRRELLADVGARQPHELLGCYVAGPETLAEIARDAPGLITDDRPWIEFTAPRSVYQPVKDAYALEIIRRLASSGDEAPFPPDTPDFVLESVQAATERLRGAALEFVEGVEAAEPGQFGWIRTRYIDALRGT